MVRSHVRVGLYREDRIDVAGLQPRGRLADNYTEVETVFGPPAENS